MAGVDFGRYKRFVQYLWNPEPKNDSQKNSPIWCLGREYSSIYQKPSSTSDASLPNGYVDVSRNVSETKEPESMTTGEGIQTAIMESDGNWPRGFLSDFESRFWFTYRSNFRPIPKSVDPAAASSMTLAVRLRSQLLDHEGFTSDTGWGCMIRSGQCLLANALGILRFGRGNTPATPYDNERSFAEVNQTGDAVVGMMKNVNFFLFLQTTRRPRFRFIVSWNTAPQVAESIQGNGLDPRLQRSAFCE